MRDLKDLFIQQKQKFSNKFDVSHSLVEGKRAAEGKDGEEGVVESAEEVVVEGVVESAEEVVVEGVKPFGEQGVV